MNSPIRALQRPGAAFAALFVAVPLILAVTAQPAHAQLEEVVDTVDDTVGGVTDEVEDTVGDGTDEVEDTVGTVNDTVEDVANPDEDPEAGPVQETIDAVTGAVDKVSGGATEPVTDAVRDTTKGVLGPVDEQIGGVTDGLLDGDAPGIGDGNTAGSLQNTSILNRIQNRDSETAGQAGVGGFDGGPATVGTPEESFERPGIQPAGSGSLVDQAEQIAREIAFPLFLLLMVGAFLSIQSRWDKRDPKLAHAPLDLDDQYLSFR